MSGIRGEAEHGQLALMDAVVFFVAAIAISSVLLYYSELPQENIVLYPGQGQADPDEVLESVLDASLGSEVVVFSVSPRHIAPETAVRECLLLESDVLAAGTDPSSFEMLNLKIETILDAACGPFFVPQLVVSTYTDGRLSPLICIPQETMISSSQFASSTDLRVGSERTLLVNLILTPSSLPEMLEVARGPLDLCPSVIATPSEFNP